MWYCKARAAWRSGDARIDPAQKDPLTPYLVNVKQTDLEPGKYNVILGEQLASQLGV